MAIDFGNRRIGIAVSTSGVVATPHSVIDRDGNEEGALDHLARVAAEIQAEVIVLGIPRTKRSDAGRTEERYRLLAEKLRQRTCRTVVLWDEALTTVAAEEKLVEAGQRSRRKRRERIDMHAAAVILQSYLDEQARRRS